MSLRLVKSLLGDDARMYVKCLKLVVLSAFGVMAEPVNDIGLAGMHRFLAEIDTLALADVVIVVAGMEGALATAVAGVVAAPVIAVPTSAGYGAALEGVTALLAMHASCAAGIMVVGIDNGFGAAMAAMRVLDLAAARRGGADRFAGPK